MHRLILCSSLLAICALPAQNLVQNGDFEGKSLAPWSVSGHAYQPQVESYDTAGRGPSASFACSPGLQSNTSPQNPLVLSQGGIVATPLLHELSFDLAVFVKPTIFSARLPQIDVFLGNSKLPAPQVAFTRPNPKRLRACVRFTPTVAGATALRFSISYQGLANSNAPRVYLDNVSLRRATNPSFCMQGERKLGGSTQLQVDGSPSAAFVIFLAAGASPAPIPLPGFIGALEIDPLTAQPFVSGALDASGTWSQKLTIPNLTGLAGIPIHWQGLEVGAMGASFGVPSVMAFYL